MLSSNVLQLAVGLAVIPALQAVAASCQQPSAVTKRSTVLYHNNGNWTVSIPIVVSFE